MPRLKTSDVVFRPCFVTGSLRLGPRDTERRIIRHTALGHRPLEDRTKRVAKIALRKWRRGLLVDDALHMLAGQQHGSPAVGVGAEERQMPVGVAEVFENVAPSALRLGGTGLER